MIFVTTGTQAPFPRLVEMMNDLTPLLQEEVVVQGEKLLSETEFATLVNKARVVVAHAGVGTLLTALRLRKPLIVVPRRAELGEQRDNHQLDTVELIREQNLCYVAGTKEELLGLLVQPNLQPQVLSEHGVPDVPGHLRKTINGLLAGRKTLAVGSFGGHILELNQILGSYQGDLVVVSSGGLCDYMVPNFSRWNKRKGFLVFWRLFYIIRHEQPEIIITTGAAPGFMAVLVGWILRKQTIWIDSLAARKHLSLSARLAQPFATHMFTQSKVLATGKIKFVGSIIN